MFIWVTDVPKLLELWEIAKAQEADDAAVERFRQESKRIVSGLRERPFGEFVCIAYMVDYLQIWPLYTVIYESFEHSQKPHAKKTKFGAQFLKKGSNTRQELEALIGRFVSNTKRLPFSY